LWLTSAVRVGQGKDEVPDGDRASDPVLSADARTQFGGALPHDWIAHRRSNPVRVDQPLEVLMGHRPDDMAGFCQALA
jgi:hypothetical protein